MRIRIQKLFRYSHAATKSGTPSLVIPFTGDRFFWAQRLAQIGVAPKPKSMIKIDTQVFTKMLKDTSSQTMIEKSRALAQRMRTEDGVENAVRHIESFINRQK